MDELFRFVVLRPAKPADPQASAPVTPSRGLMQTITEAPSVAARRRALAGYPINPAIGDYHFGAAMAAFGAWASTNATALTRDTAAKKLQALVGQDAAPLAHVPQFDDDIARLDDTLVTLKYLSRAPGADTDTLGTARLGYDLVQQLAGGAQPVLRRLVLAVPNPDPPAPQLNPAPPQPSADDIDAKLTKIATARAALRGAIRTGLTVPNGRAHQGPPERFSSPSRELAAAEERFSSASRELAVAEERSSSASREVSAVAARLYAVAADGQVRWLLDQRTVQALPRAVAETIKTYAGDPATTPAPALSQRLSDAEAELLRTKAAQSMPVTQELRQIGSNYYSSLIAVSKLPDGVLTAMPGDVHPVGVGDLLIVREHVKRYEGGDVGHIENVLRTEKLSRDTRRLDRTEQTTTVETETDKDEERDTQSTDRFSLKRETDNTVKTDAQVKAGLSVDAKYGPFVEVKADLQGSYQHQAEDVTKQATEYSKDVVSRSVSKLVTKVRQLQTTITLQEFEEKYSHGFDNTGMLAKNVSGVYQFVDKVSEAQVYNYGKRLLFDVMVPEPAAFYVWAQQQNAAETTHVTPPTPLTVTPADLDAGNYLVYAQTYGATGIDPPPAEHRTFSQTWDAVIPNDPLFFAKSGTINLDDGYAAWIAA